MKLRDIITAKGVPFGTTDTGSNWCIKALHPADPLLHVDGIPDQDAQPTVMLNKGGEFVITAPVGATPAWSCDLNMLPSAVTHGYYAATDNGGHQSAGNIWDTSHGGTPAAAEYAFLNAGGIKRFRLAYMSYTVYLDAAGLSNQGSVAAAQFPNIPTLRTICRDYEGEMHVTFPAAVWGPFPIFEELTKMGNCYTGDAKDGVYMPLKLDYTHQRWRSVWNDTFLPGNMVESAIASIVPNAQPGNVIPYVDSSFISANASVGELAGSIISSLLQENMGQISFVNLAPSSRLVVHWRLGIECQVKPNAPYGIFQKVSPQYDPEAIRAYYLIARELKDAYPGDYNDLGKLWQKIKEAASIVGPIVASLPGIPGIVGKAFVGGANVISALESGLKRARTNNRDSPPAAAVERAQENLKAQAARASAAPKAKGRLKIQRRSTK